MPYPEDPRDKVWQDRAERGADRAYDAVTYHPYRTIIKIAVGFILLSIVLGVVGCATGLIGDYANETKRTISVPNAREQVTQILNDEESMVATAGNVCSVGNAKRDPKVDPTLVENPAFAYAAQYRSIKADYDRRMENFFEASNVRHIPLPGSIRDLPQRAPTLEQRKAEVC